MLEAAGRKKYKIGSISYLMGIDKDKEFEISILEDNKSYKCYYGRKSFKNIYTNIMKVILLLFILFSIYCERMGYDIIIFYITGGCLVLMLFLSIPYVNNAYLRETLKKIGENNRK